MKLYIKQQVFSWNDKFSVMDEYGQERYYVEGEFFSLGKKLHVYNIAGGEAAFIQQKLMSFLPKYYVYVGGLQAAEIVKRLTLLRPSYSIEGPGWEVEGSFMAHDYEITQNGMPIVTIHKQWMTWGDCYELDIADPRNEILALAAVLTIDCVMASEAAGS